MKDKLNNKNYFYGSLVVLVVVFFSVIAFFSYRAYSQRRAAEVFVLEAEGLCELTFEVGHTEDIVDADIVKEFKDLQGNDVVNPVEPLERVIAEITVTNVGNVTISDLMVEDPLDNTFIEQGAQNLDLIDFVKFVVNPEEKCFYEDSSKMIACAGISLLPQDNFTFSYEVILTENLGMSKNIVNVARLTNSDNTIIKYVDDSFATTPVSNVCNFEGGYCDTVLRDKESDETACTVDSDCVVETPKHFECSDKSCLLVEGEGTNDCSEDADCAYTTCNDNDSCVEQACDSGDCTSTCENDDDCVAPTRTICEDKSCKQVNGEGRDECDSDSDCVYYTCDDNDSCVSETCETGDCQSSCDEDKDCEEENKRVCSNESCVEVSGSGADECDSDLDCEYTYVPKEPAPQVPAVPEEITYAVPETGVSTFQTMFFASFGLAITYMGYLISRKFRS
jgi:hypothetical protein